MLKINVPFCNFIRQGSIQLLVTWGLSRWFPRGTLVSSAKNNRLVKTVVTCQICHVILVSFEGVSNFASPGPVLVFKVGQILHCTVSYDNY